LLPSTPSFSSVSAFQRVLEVLHVVGEVQAHLVKAETVDLVLLRVEHDGVDHQLFHHLMLAGGVCAAGPS
jgi:hypothetical protein